MKLISLNTWCGKLYEPLKNFIEFQEKDTDIFCFQEVRNGEYVGQPAEEKEKVNLFNEIKNILPDFIGYFSEMAPGVGLATYIRNNIHIENIDSTQILSAKDLGHIRRPDGSSYYPRIMQSIFLKNLIIHNFHGVPGYLKKDTPERELQTKRIIDILNKNDAKQIIIGDFNLGIQTSAVSKLTNNMKNLIKEGNFKTTRNHNYKEIDIMPFADYAFTSEDIEIKTFEVLPDEISDHLALSLEFNIN